MAQRHTHSSIALLQYENTAYGVTNTKKILGEIALKAGFLMDARLKITSTLPINISFGGMSSAVEMYMSFFTVSEDLGIVI